MKWSLAMLALCTLLLGDPTFAHDSRPLFIELLEEEQGHYTLRWHTPATVPEDNVPEVIPPGACQPTAQTQRYVWSEALVTSTQLRCEESFGAEGFRVEYPLANPSLSSLIRFHPLEGETITQLLSPDQDRWLPPTPMSSFAIAASYTRLGISHILAGLDHLLFLFCLVWIAGSLKRIVWTVTGFTAAHSITLVLAALDIVKVPGPPLEASIALSIVFLGSELVKGRQDSLTWRHPIAVSSTFGLLHGFGFATVLQDVGLPAQDLAVGLLFFNVGVEIGQLLAIGLVLFTLSSIRAVTQGTRWRFSGEWSLQRLAGYAVGVVSTMWLMQRTAAFFS